MKILNKSILEEEGLRIEFVGWTNSTNEKYSELADEFHENQIEKEGEIILLYVPKSGKEEYVKTLKRTNLLIPLLISNRLFVKGIKFDGNYHHDGKYGCPHAVTEPVEVQPPHYLLLVIKLTHQRTHHRLRQKNIHVAWHTSLRSVCMSRNYLTRRSRG